MDMVEVERKRVLRGGADRVRSRLAQVGWTASATSRETDDYYSRPDVDFMETVECLRVRRRGGFAEITYKPASDASTTVEGVITKPETNVALGPGQEEAALRLMDALGMVHLARVDKSRTVYRRPGEEGLSVVLDEIAGVGWFAEVEVVAADAEGASERLERIEEELDLVGYPVASLPYRDMVMQAAPLG
ncbi:class IV adenylate cyclase [Nocardiopsis sp. RSe5-2]|uniref:Class IV adenylate cyclase n=1 Tax=Nocardiopsis endophytica TaxID=3018445 RepID=A0ABT4U7Z8_9ACTN|nr:class IV adenylate cyclase [Nocardiopsis endophytica]MDA2812525.1 class IV adenylate cyclase [Nocardiopsis endophytica]